MVKKQVTIIILAFILVTVSCEVTSAADGTWDVETVSEDGWRPTMAFDSADNPHIAYVNKSGLIYVKKTDAGWSDSETIDSTFVPYSFDIDIGPTDEPHISYYDQVNNDLKYAYKDFSGWNVETVPNTINGGMYNSLIIDSDGNPHISYLLLQNFNYVLAYITKTGGTWNSPEIVDNSANLGPFGTSIALDSAGNPRIAYLNDKVHSACYAYKEGAVWNHEILESQFPDTFSPFGSASLAIDSTGYPHLSLSESNYPDFQLSYIYKDLSGWHKELVDSQSYSAFIDASLTLDSNNMPHISYYDMGIRDLKYAFLSSIGWQIRKITSHTYEGEGFETTIAIDSQGYPHISYRGNLFLGQMEIFYASFVPDPTSINSSNIPSKSVSNVSAGSNYVKMQKTGLPIVVLIIGILITLTGLIIPNKGK